MGLRRAQSGYAYNRDLEKGLSSPTRAIAKRFLPTKRTRWAVILICGLIGVYQLLSYESRPPSRLRPAPDTGHDDKDADAGHLDDIWDERPLEPVKPKGRSGWGLPNPFGGHGSSEENQGSSSGGDGERIGSGGTPPSKQDQASFPAYESKQPKTALEALTWIEPMDPDMSLVPDPSTLFPEITLPEYFRPPQTEPYPEERLREIISEAPAPDPNDVNGIWHVPETAWKNQWIPPETWDDPKPLRRVQWEGFARGRDRWESDIERKVREERREAIRRGFAHGWQAYKDRAWGHDEVRPVSGRSSDPFNTWGATIVDTLGTLLLMGFSDEYNLCRPHVNHLNFHWKDGRDWTQGYISEPPPTDDDETPVETWIMPRDRTTGLPVFETSIRYLGGLISAYDLSGDQLILDRAIELAEVLSKAFNTESGLPAGRIDPGSPSDYRLGSVSVAEVGSMSVDFIRLSQITGNRTYFDLVQRAMDYLEDRVIPRSVVPPLIPLWFQPDAGLNTQMNGAFSFGGLGDSYYEYLIKTYRLLGGSQVAQVWRRVYEDSIETAKKVLFTEIDYIPDHDILAIGKLEHNRYKAEIEHLSCFAGGMLGMGSRLLDRPKDMDDGERFTASCYWLSQASKLGVQPEHVEFYPHGSKEDLVYTEVKVSGKEQHPWVDPAELERGGLDLEKMHTDRGGVIRWNSDRAPVLEREGGTGRDEKEVTVKKLKGKLPGAKVVGGRYINRPETIESVFYMYRLTGDRKWQDMGWKMFVSWMNVAKVDGGFSSIEDVTRDTPRYGDNMESFTLAETFKYHLLLQSDPELISLDDYVLNTEAHSFIANKDIEPGSQRLWHPPPDPYADLGVRGQGTDVQKWARQAILWRGKASPPPPREPVYHHDPKQFEYKGRKKEEEVPQQPPQFQGGGKGMGGGGGSPDFRPRPPGW